MHCENLKLLNVICRHVQCVNKGSHRATLSRSWTSALYLERPDANLGR